MEDPIFFMGYTNDRIDQLTLEIEQFQQAFLSAFNEFLSEIQIGMNAMRRDPDMKIFFDLFAKVYSYICVCIKWYVVVS